MLNRPLGRQLQKQDLYFLAELNFEKMDQV
jgi:hypothetical protein